MNAMETNLVKLAATSAPKTKVAARAVLKAAGLKQTLADELLAATDRLAALRKGAKLARISQRVGHAISNPITSRKHTASPPKGSPAARLATIRRAAVESTYANAYRQAAHGELSVTLTTDPAAVGVSQTEGLDYDLYRGAHKGRPARVQNTIITVPATWRVRVQRAGLAVIDGMMTLDAARIESVGCELYAAVWIVQGRGTSATAQRGYIAKSESISYHAATADQALTGLARKARELAFSARLDAADLGELVARCTGSLVSVSDARQIGACEYGIKSWCATVGLDYDAGRATLGEVYAAYQREPRPEARATILRALRRNRAALAA